MAKKRKQKLTEVQNKEEVIENSGLEPQETITLSNEDFDHMVASEDTPPNDKLVDLISEKHTEFKDTKNVAESHNKETIDAIRDVMEKHKKTFDKLAEIDKPLMNIDEAARKFIEGFKEHWLPGIKTRCTLMGMDINGVYEDTQWKNLFIAWGGSRIIKK